ncbi:MAG: 23S rRNA (adenine(2030)-N(6))-methyltransferase RlmJ [Dokdonella sp.]
MNYRHAFHAGNFADVFKHTILIALLDALKAKPAAFCYFDTHAGRGRYDLRSDEASRTLEYADGVQRVLAAQQLPLALQAYADLLRAFDDRASVHCSPNPLDGTPSLEPASGGNYPGSPLIAAHCMRAQDRAIVCELHGEEAAALKLALRDDARFAVHRRDGYAALKALLPPAQKRGVVLIDPPFEAQAAEYVLIQNALVDSIARWPQAIHAIWYPIKLREPILPFHRWLARHAGSADVLVVELLLHADNSGLRLNGCGLAILNPPWRFDRQLAAWLPTLAALLAQGDPATCRSDWLKKN